MHFFNISVLSYSQQIHGALSWVFYSLNRYFFLYTLPPSFFLHPRKKNYQNSQQTPFFIFVFFFYFFSYFKLFFIYTFAVSPSCLFFCDAKTGCNLFLCTKYFTSENRKKKNNVGEEGRRQREERGWGGGMFQKYYDEYYLLKLYKSMFL